jgi:autotransporter-associated beta strand protein
MNTKSFLKKSILTSAFLLMFCMGARAQLNWEGDQFLSNGQTVSQNITLTGTTTIWVSSGTATISGVISGNHWLKKAGAGKLILTGINTINNHLEVSDGVLQIGNGISGRIDDVTDVLLNSTSSVLRFEPGVSSYPYYPNFSKVISGTGKVEFKGNTDDKRLYFLADNTYTGTTTIEAGTLIIGNYTTTGAIVGDVINNGNLYFFRIGDCTYNGVISGTGNVARLAIGSSGDIFTLGGENSYTGETITVATLVLNSNGSIENSSSVTLEYSIGSPKFDISAGNKKIKALNSTNSNGNGEVILGSSTLTIGTAGQNDGGGYFVDKFTGTGGVTKTGNDVFIMGGVNTATGVFTHSEGEVNLTGTWAGNYNKLANTTLTVAGNRTIGGALNLAGGVINMNLTSTNPSKISVVGAMSASGTNTFNITANLGEYILIQAASGIDDTTPFTVNMTGVYTHLVATGTQLKLIVSSMPISPVIITTTLPGGVIGTSYSEKLSATGMTPITWSLEDGALPPGISVASNGIVSGTPTTEGTFNFTVKATNGVGSDVKKLSLTVSTNVIAPIITTTELPDGITGNPYSQNLVATGSSPITWSLESDNLPNGLDLNGNAISGTPTTAGTFSFTVKAANSAGSNTKTLTIKINQAIEPPHITTENLSDGAVGTEYNEILTAEGNTPISWSLESGNLPNGLNLYGSGAISGTPKAEGVFTFTVKAQNSVGSDTKEFYIKIDGVGIEAPPSPPEGGDVRVYPNPTRGEVIIEMGDMEYGICDIEIFDIMGKKVSHLTISHPISISHLPAGMYFLRIQTETGIITKKIVKQ